jgi:hypothetical protein
MSRARLRAIPIDEVVAIVRRAPPPAPARGCICARCIVNALARLHAELAAGAHADPAAALARVMHERFSQKTLARAARGELPCKEPAR